MMIESRGLTKRYGTMLAADHVTFNVAKGSILGFLGPNGAGKSTTMKMLSCFMPPTAGTARVAGCDILEDSLGVRRRLGYLPESVPLYTDMRVREYLSFRCKIKRVPRRQRKSRIDYVIERCGIDNVRNRIIGQLSKGYRQRVGLADAMVHNPDVLILDEPTVGLDPMQIREVRSLIKSLAEAHTVLLSTHILPEVDMICDAVVIIRRGRIVLTDTLANLTRAGADRVIVRLRAGEPEALGAFGSMPGVRSVEARRRKEDDEPGVVELALTAQPETDLREAAFQKAVQCGFALVELRRDVPTLEEVYMKTVTGEEDEKIAADGGLQAPQEAGEGADETGAGQSAEGGPEQ